jgi:plasmid stabilization system protein ParE
MTYEVFLTPKAKVEIKQISQWWAENRSNRQAHQWTQSVGRQLARLSEAPESHSLSAENGMVSIVLRDLLVGIGRRPTHRAVFTVHGKVVFILTVRHLAQDSIEPETIDLD